MKNEGIVLALVCGVWCVVCGIGGGGGGGGEVVVCCDVDMLTTKWDVCRCVNGSDYWLVFTCVVNTGCWTGKDAEKEQRERS